MIGPAPYVPGALEAITSGFAGQTVDQIWNNNNMDDPLDDGFGVGNWTSDEPSISGNTSGTISDNSEPVAVDAWHDYVENTPTNVSDVTGGIVDGSSVDTINFSIKDNGEGDYEAVQPVAVPIDKAVIGIAKALGVAMDYNLIDESVAVALTKAIVDADGVYNDARDKVKAWRDRLGNILFPKSTADALAAALEELGIPVGGSTHDKASSSYITGSIEVGTSLVYVHSYTSQGYLYVVTDTLTAYGSAKIATLWHEVPGDGKSYVVYVAKDYNVDGYATRHTVRTKDGNPDSDTTTTYRPTSSSTTHDSKKSAAQQAFTIAYYDISRPNDGFSLDAPSVEGEMSNFGTLANFGWTMIFGTITPGGEYPEGTAPSSAAESYTPATYPISGSIVTNEDGTDSIDVVEANIPEDTSTIGDDTGVLDPTDEGVIDEFPPSPLPIPVPDTKPSNPDVPLVNPAVVDQALINELVEELANTLDPQAPQSSGLIPVPPLPGVYDPETGQTTFPSIIPQSGPGFIHVYNPTPAEFVAFGTWLWVTYADATIDKILNNPFDGVIGAHELYATPNRDGSDNIRSAFLTCPTTAALVTNRYSEIDCGTVIVPEFYGNYLDYSPYSQAYIYLPFIGINEVSIDDIVGHAVNIRYRVDSYSGSCIAMIFVAKDGYQNLCYQFAGSCSVEVPMAGGSQAAIKAGMMQAEAYARAAMIQAGANAVGGVGSALMGNIGGVLSSLSGIASNYAQAQAGVEAARVANKSSVQHSGQFGASHGAMGEKVPFIIVRNPIQVKVVNYNEDYGFPAHKRVIVGGCRGYLRVREVNVISAHATDEEKMAIEMALKGGVYVS